MIGVFSPPQISPSWESWRRSEGSPNRNGGCHSHELLADAIFRVPVPGADATTAWPCLRRQRAKLAAQCSLQDQARQVQASSKRQAPAADFRCGQHSGCAAGAARAQGALLAVLAKPAGHESAQHPAHLQCQRLFNSGDNVGIHPCNCSDAPGRAEPDRRAHAVCKGSEVVRVAVAASVSAHRG